MNKKLNKIALIAITSFAFVSTTVATISWFVANAQAEQYNLKGKSAGAYFAYGDGLPYEEDADGKVIHRPYGISIPRHLYNLAWLQYMGQFEDGQYYFEIATSVDDEDGLDMDGYILPPIGTEEKPFVGNFNGNGKIITNLTVSNDESAIFAVGNKHPDETQVNYSAPKIVGLFGVVGNYNNEYEGETAYASSTNSIYNLGINNATIQTTTSSALVGIAAGYVDAVVSNVAVNGSTIDIKTANTTAVDAENLTSNLSDYGTVGYVTSDYKRSIKKIDQELYDVEIGPNAEFNASDEGDSQGWGGSINMKTIYHRIIALRKHKASNVEGSFNWLENKHYYDNVLNDSETTGVKALQAENNRTPHYQRYSGFNETGHEYIGNYNIYIRNATFQGTGATTDQSYLYMGGGHLESKEYQTHYSHTGRYITDGTNYLCFDGTSLYNSTNSSDATLWSFSNTSGTATISTQYNGTTYYLKNNSGALTTGTSGATTWTLTISGNTLKIVNDSYKLIFLNGQWILNNGNPVPYYYLTQNNRYMTTANSGSTPGNTQNTNNASHWYIESGTNYLYYLNGSTKMYLAIYYTYTVSNYGGYYYYINNTTTNLRVINNSSEANYYYFTYNSGTPVAVVPIASIRSYNSSNVTITNTNYYFRYNNNNFTYTTENNNRGTCTQGGSDTIANFNNLSISNTLNNTETTKTGPDMHQTSEDIAKSTTATYYTATDTTYFPLNVEKDVNTYITNASDLTTKINNNDLDPKDSNTGYIIAGSSYTSDLTGAYTYNSSQTTNIRISEYPSTSGDNNISNSFKTSYNTLAKFVDTTIYTLNTSGTRKSMSEVYSENSYPRYKESKESFYKNSLTTAYNQNTQQYTCTSNVYGLHFMASTISKDSIVDASKVSILGNKCDTYQFPVNCVDFNLKQKGVINFFAGTYFPGNDSFFSVHEIIRNNDAVQKVDGSGEPIEGQYSSFNTINDIKEIEEIFSNDQGTKTTKYSNIYKYKGKTGNAMYSVPYRVDGNQNKYVMNKNNTDDNQTAYSYATMGQSDFDAYAATYGYTSRFKTSQIGINSLTSNAIYYFEFPMNPGEYCLGSVKDGTGAYLLYLDIGANAAKTQRTTIYEHYKEIKKVFDYPAGVAIVEVTTVATNIANNSELDDTDTANFLIKSGTNGTIKVTRAANDVEMARTGGLGGGTPNAKPTLVGDLMWNSQYLQYNIHRPSSEEGTYNLTGEIESKDTTTEVRRLQYYDYNVNLDELVITHIIDTSTDGGETWTRTFYQKFGNGEETTTFSEMKIYNTSGGTKYTSESDTASIATYLGDAANDTLIVKISYQEDAGEDITYVWLLEMMVNENGTGRYYIFQDYVFEATIESGSITLTVVSLGNKTIKINSTTITTVGQEVVLTPSAQNP